MNDEWLSTVEAAEYIGVDPSIIRRYIVKGVLPSKKRAGRRWVYVDDLRDLKRQRNKGSKTDPKPIVIGGEDT